MVNSATSWRPTKISFCLREIVSRVEASMTLSMDSMPHSTSWEASLRMYFRPLEKGCLPSQKTRALKLESSKGGAVSSATTEPRATKICSVKVMPIDSPAKAWVGDKRGAAGFPESGCPGGSTPSEPEEERGGTFQRSMVLTVLVLLVGEKTS